MKLYEPGGTSLRFDVADQVRDLGIRGAYFLMTGIRNAEADSAFSKLADEVTCNFYNETSLEAIRQDPVLEGFRRLHDRIGASNRKHVASPENLLNYVLRTGQLPRVNLVVDIYNLVSLETRLALGAHDAHKISGAVHFTITSGKERFVPLGTDTVKAVRQGMYAYVDDDLDVLCFLEVRQVEKSKVTGETTDCFYIVQGNPATPMSSISSAMNRTVELTQTYCGGHVVRLSILE